MLSLCAQPEGRAEGKELGFGDDERNKNMVIFCLQQQSANCLNHSQYC